jgi:hypothetical protein
MFLTPGGLGQQRNRGREPPAGIIHDTSLHRGAADVQADKQWRSRHAGPLPDKLGSEVNLAKRASKSTAIK